jgi:mRNA-degrading endonuclease YafQ of YafQ-DinJ toxin-antitoxin module
MPPIFTRCVRIAVSGLISVQINTKTLELLTVNPHHPSLRLHSLKGKLAGLHSVSINLKYRITLELIITENEIIPISVGDHDEVY